MSIRNEEDFPRERAPLRPGDTATSYGSAESSRLRSTQPPPSYSPGPGHSNGEYQTINDQRIWSWGPPPRLMTGGSVWGWVIRLVICLALVAQFGSFLFFYDLPTKIGQYNEVMDGMRELERAMRKEAKNLESERTALQDETARMEEERLALNSTILEMEEERLVLNSTIFKMEEERLSLESAIRHSEEEISRLEEQKRLLEDERQSLERERLALKKEREKWEKAHGDRPPGAFWETVRPAHECLAYGKREYWGILQNIPEGWSDFQACMNMPVEIRGVNVKPSRCQHVVGSPHIHGFWTVDWDQLDCQPWHTEFHDTGCTNPGSGMRRIEATVLGINDAPGQDWRVMCETTPMTWDHITYETPTHCDKRYRGRKVAMWDIVDSSC